MRSGAGEPVCASMCRLHLACHRLMEGRAMADLRPVCWYEAEESCRGMPLHILLSPNGQMCHSGQFHWTTERPNTSNPVWPLYAAHQLSDGQVTALIKPAMKYYGYDPEYATLTSGAGFVNLVRAVEREVLCAAGVAVAPAPDPEWAKKDMRILIEVLRKDTHFDADLIEAMLTFAQNAARGVTTAVSDAQVDAFIHLVQQHLRFKSSDNEYSRTVEAPGWYEDIRSALASHGVTATPDPIGWTTQEQVDNAREGITAISVRSGDFNVPLYLHPPTGVAGKDGETFSEQTPMEGNKG